MGGDTNPLVKPCAFSQAHPLGGAVGCVTDERDTFLQGAREEHKISPAAAAPVEVIPLKTIFDMASVDLEGPPDE